KLLAARSAVGPAVRLWNTGTGKEIATVALPTEAPKGDGVVLAEVTGVLTPDLAFSPDGRHLAGAGAKRQLTLWDAATGDTVWEVALGAGQNVERFAFSPNGRCLAAANGDGTVSLYEAATGARRGRLGEPDKSGGGALTVNFGGMSFALLGAREDVPVCV